MADFARAVAWVLEHEGAETDDPADPGGRTRFGLSQRGNPDLDIGSLTRAQAVEVYRLRYWRKIRGEELPEALGLALFDYAVLQGAPTAIRALQGILGVRQDGKLGPLTLAAVDARAPGPLAREILALRKRQLVASADLHYRVGWLSRLVDLALAI